MRFQSGKEEFQMWGPVKLDTVLPTARHRCEISSKRAVFPTGAMTRRLAPQTCFTLWRNQYRCQNKRSEGALAKSGGAQNLHKKLISTSCTATIMRNFKIKAGSASSLVSSAAHNYLKIYLPQ